MLTTRTTPGTMWRIEFRPPPEVVQPNWKSILPRSVDTSSRSATIKSMRHLFALAGISRQNGADVEVRYIAVPDDWVPPKPGSSTRRR
jgi:hypothetical protein